MSEQEQPDYRFFNFNQTSHDHVGHALGLADPPFQRQAWWARPAPMPFAQSCFDVVRQLHPSLIDEFRAYADAQQWHVQDLWQQCCRVNLKAHIRAKTLEDQGEGCSTFVWYPPPTMSVGQYSYARSRYALIGRNYDYWPMQARRQRLRFVPHSHAYATIGARGGVPGGRYDGLNEHGLWASLHVVMTDNPTEDEVPAGVPFHVVCRMALELCRTAREAVDLLLNIPHLSSLNYLLADPHEAFVVEADPRRVRAMPMEGSRMAATNHYRHPDMQPLQGQRQHTNSACRLNFLLDEHAETITSTNDEATWLDYAEKVMADRTAPVCGNSGALTTLWSCVAELGSGRVRYAPGQPSTTPFEDIEPVSRVSTAA